jgi:hypothetical protein
MPTQTRHIIWLEVDGRGKVKDLMVDGNRLCFTPDLREQGEELRAACTHAATMAMALHQPPEERANICWIQNGKVVCV